jgi:glycosyltransferase involved in cell wall biosynthesis
MSRPSVTVLIDTYNHERFIEEAIASVLEQDFPPSEMEILVVDDGSTDRTPEIVRQFEPRVRLLRKANGGQASAFNAGIPEAKGEVVAFLDGDDWWAMNKLRVVMDTFEGNPQAGSIGHGIFEFDSDSKTSRTLTPGTTQYFDLSTNQGAQTFRNFMAFLGTSRVSIRRSVLAKVLPIPEALVVEADEFMSTMAVAYGGAVLLPDLLTFYRLHDGNLFQFRQHDPVRARRKMMVLNCLVRELSPRLQAEGVMRSAITTVVDPIQVMADRMKLGLEGGKPWQTFHAERKDFRFAYKDSSVPHKIFKYLVLGITLLLPPRAFYRLKNWYSASGLRKLRGVLGEPISRAEITITTVPQQATGVVSTQDQSVPRRHS